MENFKTELVAIADDRKIAMSGDKIKQDVRNALRKNLLDVLAVDLKEFLACESVQVERVEKGAVIVLDNATAGFIPILVDLKFMNIAEFDLDVEIDSYKMKLEEQARAKAEAEKKKAVKIEQDKARRAKAQEIRDRAKGE